MVCHGHPEPHRQATGACTATVAEALILGKASDECRLAVKRGVAAWRCLLRCNAQRAVITLRGAMPVRRYPELKVCSDFTWKQRPFS